MDCNSGQPVQILNLYDLRERTRLHGVKPGFGRFCPVAVASEVFAERWTPLILRELLRRLARFNEIHRGVPLMSRALLSRRLRTLEDLGVITKAAAAETRARHYALTPSPG